MATRNGKARIRLNAFRHGLTPDPGLRLEGGRKAALPVLVIDRAVPVRGRRRARYFTTMFTSLSGTVMISTTDLPSRMGFTFSSALGLVAFALAIGIPVSLLCAWVVEAKFFGLQAGRPGVDRRGAGGAGGVVGGVSAGAESGEGGSTGGAAVRVSGPGYSPRARDALRA